MKVEDSGGIDIDSDDDSIVEVSYDLTLEE